MKTLLKWSLLLNVALLTVLALIELRFREPHKVATRQAPEATLPGPVSATQASTASTAPMRVREAGVAQPFQWSQLLSTNSLAEFVANLRSAGCPEAVVEDIVRGAVARSFAARQEEMHLSNTLSGPWSQKAQQRLVDTIMNSGPSQSLAAPGAAEPFVTTVAEQDGPARRSNRTSAGPERLAQAALASRAKIAPVALPLVFQQVDPSTLSLNDQQAEKIGEIRQTFVQNVGGPDQNPEDPAYLARWQQAEPIANGDLLINLGWNAYFEYQVAAHQKALEQRESQIGSADYSE